MPKETFDDTRGSWTYSEGEDQTETKVSLALEVGWGMESTVTIASVNEADESTGPTRGWFVELDRSNLNRLIKALRKARDQAYGEDA